ncbi:MAG: DsbA family protein [Sphingobium sp.]|jgi:protein-disulfide isomerase|nr:DsbA family protein [Sphingobium sp.]MCI1272125.1 DsbA family protein [Sphingobium sp.]MCI1757151.1 DsbA family protein [Sphingobium sp.]MCI2054257.1 DsbA family protein [Sphingobium sp.]
MIRALLLFLGLVLVPAAAQAAPAKDWSQTVTLTKEGAHVIGNPAAKTRLVEYVSYTCPHCAHFVAEGTAPLKAGWVSRGTVAVEIRNLVRDRYDFTVALLARCGGPAKFPGNHEALFAAQNDWIAKAQAYEGQSSALPADAKPAAIMAEIADKTGMLALLAKRGVTPAQSRICIASQPAFNALMAMTKRALEQDHVTGTPSFLINGTLTEAHDWASLRPLLPRAAN